MNDDDRDAMIRTIIGEAAQEPPEGQAAVAHVIMNRVNSGKWGASPSSVVFAPGQFEPWQTRFGELSNISKKSPQYQQIGRIVDDVSGGEPDFTGGATHFLNPKIVMQRRGSLPDWAQGSSLAIGNHRFYSPNNPTYNPTDAAINSVVQTPDNGSTAIKAAIMSSNNDGSAAIRAALGLGAP